MTRLKAVEDIFALGRCRGFHGYAIGLSLQSHRYAGERPSRIVGDAALNRSSRLRERRHGCQQTEQNPHTPSTGGKRQLDWSTFGARRHVKSLSWMDAQRAVQT